ncbi:PucR family transcriptional regulator [Cryobacterium sp. TMT1-2-2]|uniref:PucR family transcriptional regulator n=1 Tax=Cryobacterium sp. TMT1-2-2 TaxID=1259233 RepID=UPI0010692EA8|nr:helix-turn-helix domain-containing protein [Cryobacterium sp. TMT1-2-2]TFD10958.1 PucR family transcriptional regulator [Cryobacterium sp. TMT1-2-2]
MTSLGLPVGDLFALANAIAAMVGGATAIEDVQTRVLAYSTLPDQPIDDTRRDGILGRQVPDLPDNDEAYASLFRARGAVRLPGAMTPNLPGEPAVPVGLARLAVAVRAGTEPLGSIWVVDATGELDAAAAAELERAADIAAMHILRARSAADLARAQRAVLLRRLLDGDTDARLVAAQLGLDPGSQYVALAFQPQFGSAGDELRMNRLVDLVAMACEAHQSGTECVAIGTTVYALFFGQQLNDAQLVSIEAMAARLVARATIAMRIALRASVGSRVSRVDTIARSRRDADLVLLLTDPAGPVVSARNVGSRLSLLELGQVLRDTPRLFSSQARAVLDLDERSGTEYALTLRTYLDCGRDSARTAGLLSVHQNTLRYRLRRVRDLFTIDLDNADDTLTLWLSLRVAD